MCPFSIEMFDLPTNLKWLCRNERGFDLGCAYMCAFSNVWKWKLNVNNIPMPPLQYNGVSISAFWNFFRYLFGPLQNVYALNKINLEADETTVCPCLLALINKLHLRYSDWARKSFAPWLVTSRVVKTSKGSHCIACEYKFCCLWTRVCASL